MRGRTNVLGFSEDFINADIVDAVADESILSGNFVKFYNAVNGGITLNGYYRYIQQLSDDRFMCVGTKQNALNQYKIYITILNRDSDGNYTQTIPDFETNISSSFESRYINSNNMNDIFKVDDDTVAILFLQRVFTRTQHIDDTANLQIKISYLHFDVLTDQISQYDDVKNIPSGSNTVNYLNITSDLYYYSYAAYNDLSKFEIVNSKFSIYKDGNDLYIACGFIYVHDWYRSSGSNSNYYAYALLCIKASINPSNHTISVNYGRVIYLDYNSEYLAMYLNIDVRMVRSSSGSGFFILNYDSPYFYRESLANMPLIQLAWYKLFFVSDSAFVNKNQAIPNAITFTNKFGSDAAELIPIVERNDFLYFIYAKSNVSGWNGPGYGETYWFKVHFYNYTREGYDYLIYDLVDTGLFTFRCISDRNASLYLNNDHSMNMSFLYENNDIVRFYFMFVRKANNISNDYTSFYSSLLIDIDKDNNEIIVNPESEISVVNPSGNFEFLSYVGSIFPNVFTGNNSFVIFRICDIIEFEIVDDSELSGGVSNIRHVQNAVNENYIMGVARQSGSAGDVIECYKARVT